MYDVKLYEVDTNQYRRLQGLRNAQNRSFDNHKMDSKNPPTFFASREREGFALHNFVFSINKRHLRMDFLTNTIINTFSDMSSNIHIDI